MKQKAPKLLGRYSSHTFVMHIAMRVRCWIGSEYLPFPPNTNLLSSIYRKTIDK